MAKNQPRKPREVVIEVEEASAGEAQRVDARAVRARAEAPSVLSQEELDARQARIGERRRWGGPTLGSGRGAREARTESAVDVPPTECADPPASD